MRQVSGLAQTEGSSAAYRMAHSLIVQATMQDAGLGLAVAKALSDDGLIGWSNLINAVLLGIVTRRPDLTMPCAIAWTTLSLPYYAEPYFRESHTGEILEAAVDKAAEDSLELLVDTLREAIETESLFAIRGLLVEKLYAAALKRGPVPATLESALRRWKAEAPFERDTGTPAKYDEIEDFAELKAVFEKEAVDPQGYEAPRAFNRLARTVAFDVALDVFGHVKAIQRDSESRFLLVDLALDAGRHDEARKLVADYNLKQDQSATWARWMGGGALRYFRALVKLEGPAAQALAYENFVGALAAGSEFILAVLMEIEDILPVVDPAPDWVAAWDLLAEQLSTTREHAMGRSFEVNDTSSTDEAVLAEMFRWALAIPLLELQRHAQRGAQQLASSPPGTDIFERLMLSLTVGEGDAPVTALQILLASQRGAVPESLRNQIHLLINRSDFAVTEMATSLLRQWKVPYSATHTPLPPFYSFALNENGERFNVEVLADDESGAMRIQDPLGWTAIFPGLVDALARGDVTRTHIRLRCAMLVERWGGLAVFGQTATDSLLATLRRLHLQIQFQRPHVMVALRALRYVAEELRSAGMIATHEKPWLLHLMGLPVFARSFIESTIRPSFIVHPALDKGGWIGEEVGKKWINDADCDLRPLVPPHGRIIAEISVFQIRKMRQTYGLKRLRAPFLGIADLEDFDDAVESLPKSIWLDQVHDLTNEAARTIVRRFSYSYAWDIPHYQLALCTHWMNKLGWSTQAENPFAYMDRSGCLVAQVIWWRDGGPIDVAEDVTWGEGVFLHVTPKGLMDLQSVCGNLEIFGVATRKFVPSEKEAEPRAATVMGPT